MSEDRYKVWIDRCLEQWEWRCGCGAGGVGAHEKMLAEGKQHQFGHVAIVHVRSQDDQPYGSERRCCNHCGVMLWGSSSPPFVDNWPDWRSAPNNCSQEKL